MGGSFYGIVSLSGGSFMESISSSPLEPTIQESDSEFEELDTEIVETSEGSSEAEAESSEIEIVIAEILDFSESDTQLENYQAFDKLKRRLERFNQRELPEKLRARLKRAKDIILRVSKIKFLIKDSKSAIDKAKIALSNITKALEEMEHGMDQNAYRNEKERRILPLASRLVDIRNRILIEHSKDIQKYPDLVDALKDINEILDQIEAADITTARALHGLHLEGGLPVGFERIVEITVREYQQLNALDLAGEKTSVRAFHTFQEQHRKSTREDITVPHQFIPIERTRIEPRNLDRNDSSVYLTAVNIKTTKEVYNLIKNDIKEFTRDIDYNSWHALIDFIDFYHTFNPPVKSIEAFRRFDPQARRIQEFGHSCSGQSIAIVDHLAEKYNLQGYPLVQREGKFGIPMHTASIIPCRDGILLIETQNKNQPIVAVKSGIKTNAAMFGDQCVLEIDSTEGPYAKLIRRAEIRLPDGSLKIFKTEFPLEELSIRAVMLRYIVDRVEYALVSKKHDYSILINMHDGKIVFKKGKGNDAKRKTLEFKDLDSSKMDKLLDKYYQKIAMPKPEVMAMLRKLSDNQAVIKDLLTKIRSPIPTYK